jgi:protein-disulfide isomerase
LVLIAAAFIAVAIAIYRGSGGAPPKPGSPQAKADVAAAGELLRGIPEAGVTLGSPRAPVTVTEFADLECSVCRAFALGAERQLIAHEVRSGRVKLVYRSLCTATCAGPLGADGFEAQQAAAYAAGKQHLAWYYIELFYSEQGTEGTSYVTPRYLDGLARQVPGLDYRQWRSNAALAPLRKAVASDERAAARQRFGTTPTVVVQGPRGKAQPIVGEAAYGTLRAAIKSVT